MVEHCRRCGVDSLRKPLVDGKRVCIQCDQKIAEQNAERSAYKREWERTKHGAMPLADYRRSLDAIHEARKSLLVAWAQLHGIIPPLSVVADLIGAYSSNPTGGNTGAGRSAPQLLRREAFGLNTKRSGRADVPYPVPQKFLSHE